MVLVQRAPRRSPLGEAGRMVHCTKGVLGASHWVDGEKRAKAYDKKITAMNDRFTVRVWRTHLPHHRRVPDFPHCAPCFASFMLDNDAAWQNEFA